MSNIIELPAHLKDRMSTVEQRCVVIEVGPAAWTEEKVPRAGPGDRVLVAKYSGHQVVGVADGIQYRLVNDRDVFCGLAADDLAKVEVDHAGAKVTIAHGPIDQGETPYVPEAA